MKMDNSKRHAVLASIALLVAIALLGAGAPLAAATAVKTVQVPLTGISGLGNNVAFAFNRYVFVAPYAPSPVENENDLSLYDNHFLYILDSKKGNGAPVAIDLKWFDKSETLTNRLFYPTKVVFEPNTSTLFIRGTRFVASDEGYDPVEVIAYTHVNLDDNGKPLADEFLVPVDIQGVGTPTCGYAPTEFAVGQDGKYVVFSNGADVFTFSVSQGYIYRVEIVHPNEFDPDTNSISFLGVDPQTNVISVCWNQTKKQDDGPSVTHSEISLYGLSSDGTMPLLKRALAETFADGAYLTPGSNIFVTGNADKGTPDSAWFATADGVLNQIDLKNDPDTVLIEAKGVQSLPELAAGDVGDPGPRIVSFDPDRKTIVVVNRGYSAQISRPSNGRRGGISRPSNGHRVVEAAAVSMVRLSKKNRVLSHGSVTTPFADGGGLTNAVRNADGQWLVSTYSGSLFSITLQDDLTSLNSAFLGNIGSRTERVAFFDARNNVIGVNSFEADDTGLNVVDPGSVSIGKFFDSSAQSASAMMSSQPSASGSSKTSQIRRPCNDKK